VFQNFLDSKVPNFYFRKGLKLFEFENVFDLDSNLGFKFKSAAKIFEKHFHFLLTGQNHFQRTTPSSPPPHSPASLAQPPRSGPSDPPSHPGFFLLWTMLHPTTGCSRHHLWPT
jgi:hypothetical protein